MAGKLQRDSLGEELRVLYVAMTRAQEKLILTGGLKAERAEKLKEEMEKAAVREKDDGTLTEGADTERLLPFFRRSGASSYLDWLLPAWQQTGQRMELVDASRLLAGQMEKEQSREQQLQGLKQFFGDRTGRSRGNRGNGGPRRGGPSFGPPEERISPPESGAAVYQNHRIGTEEGGDGGSCRGGLPPV